MDNYQKQIRDAEKQRELMFEAMEYLLRHPETGFKEWKTQEYLVSVFEKLGYQLTLAGNIPGFYTDIDTGKPGPTLLIMGEMDALCVPAHPFADPETHAAHACGHCAQVAALCGVAAALKEPGALDGLCGRIRLMAVPAEECIELDFREELRRQGIIHFIGGKPEMIYRGFMEGVDLDILIHTATGRAGDVSVAWGANGTVSENFTFLGKAAHAAGRPSMGINALYAATTALGAMNALRETFRDEDHTRMHPILTNGGLAANVIPSEAVIESTVRGATLDAIRRVRSKVHRAVAGSAMAIGANVTISSRPGYMPQNYTENMRQAAANAVRAAVGEEHLIMEKKWGNASSDMGDMSSILPTAYLHVHGATGSGHGADYRMEDRESLVVNAAKVLCVFVRQMLENNAEAAKAAVAGFEPIYESREAYVRGKDEFEADFTAIEYHEDGTASVRFD